MTYEEIQEKFPKEFAQRDEDKYHYRYPKGEVKTASQTTAANGSLSEVSLHMSPTNIPVYSAHTNTPHPQPHS